MKKDLTSICDYMKKLVIPYTPDDFVVAAPFRHGLTDKELRKGIEAFREFLIDFYNYLAENKEKIDVKTGYRYDINGAWNGTGSINGAFPIFCDMSHILVNFGMNGRLEADGKTLRVYYGDLSNVICERSHKYMALEKKSKERKLELIHILSVLGLRFDGKDFSTGVSFPKAEDFAITSEKNELFALGLKLISEAAVNTKYQYYLVNMLQGAFLRCDFYPLANIKPKKHIVNIKEFLNPQPPEIKEWVMDIDHLLTSHGCSLSNNIAGYDCELTYIKRGMKNLKGMVCRFFMSIRGVYIMPGMNHFEYPNKIPLDNPNNRELMKKWIEMELAL